MKSLQIISILLLIVFTTACQRSFDRSASVQPEASNQSNDSESIALRRGEATDTKMASINEETLVSQQVSLNQVDQARSIAEAMERKILRDGQLTLELSTPVEAQQKIVLIAESLGGFVVTSESKQLQNADTSKQSLQITLVVRVPSPQFGSAVDQIRGIGGRVIQEKITGQDVTEEFIDLEARLKTQRALEAQFLEIMKQARRVEEALNVQRQIAEVRTEIERLEGRKRFLENRSALSTITIVLQSPPAIVVSTSSFGRSVREAMGDGVEVVAALVLFLIRFVIVVTPVLLLVVLPGWLVTRYVMRRRRLKVASQLQSEAG